METLGGCVGFVSVRRVGGGGILQIKFRRGANGVEYRAPRRRGTTRHRGSPGPDAVNGRGDTTIGPKCGAVNGWHVGGRVSSPMPRSSLRAKMTPTKQIRTNQQTTREWRFGGAEYRAGRTGRTTRYGGSPGAVPWRGGAIRCAGRSVGQGGKAGMLGPGYRCQPLQAPGKNMHHQDSTHARAQTHRLIRPGVN